MSSQNAAFGPIPDHIAANFTTMVEAAKNGDLAVLSGADAATGEPRYIICSVHREDDGRYMMTPFGHMCAGNGFEEYRPPHEPEDQKDARIA